MHPRGLHGPQTISEPNVVEQKSNLHTMICTPRTARYRYTYRTSQITPRSFCNKFCNKYSPHSSHFLCRKNTKIIRPTACQTSQSAQTRLKAPQQHLRLLPQYPSATACRTFTRKITTLVVLSLGNATLLMLHLLKLLSVQQKVCTELACLFLPPLILAGSGG